MQRVYFDFRTQFESYESEKLRCESRLIGFIVAILRVLAKPLNL
jgi:hypothetical protein